MNTNKLLNDVKTLTEKFVANNYLDELPYLETFWQVFRSKLEDIINLDNTVELNLRPSSQIISEISLVRENSLDLMTPVIMGVMAEIMINSRAGELPAEKLENIISSSAARQGAKPSLTATLLRNLPKLYYDLARINDNEPARVFETTIQYRIWTQGREDVVESIKEFEKNKTRYLFWIDLDEKQNISLINPELKLPRRSAEVLHYYVKNIGRTVPNIKLYNDIFDEITEFDERARNNIQKNFSMLHKFSGNKFRQHLITNHSKGYGLKDSFKDKYFLFERIQ